MYCSYDVVFHENWFKKWLDFFMPLIDRHISCLTWNVRPKLLKLFDKVSWSWPKGNENTNKCPKRTFVKKIKGLKSTEFLLRSVFLFLWFYYCIINYKGDKQLKKFYTCNWSAWNLTVNIESCRMLIKACSVFYQTRISSSIFYRNSADVNMANHISVNRYVLPNQESETKKFIWYIRNLEMLTWLITSRWIS